MAMVEGGRDPSSLVLASLNSPPLLVSPLAEEHFTVPCALALTALYIHAREIFPRACFGCCQVAIVVGLPLALWLYYRHRPKPSLYDHTRDDRLENPIMSHRHHP